MPNRILKESICTSDNLNNLKPEEEVFFYRLLVSCDDYGRMDGRPQIIRAKCYPLKLDSVKDKDIEKLLDVLVKEKLIHLYEVEGFLYIQMATWEKHQQVRAKKSRYPSPNEGKILMKSSEIKRNQVKSNVPVIQSNPIQSESNPIPIVREDSEKIPYADIINYLNQKTGKGYKHTTNKTQECIHARWNEGFRLDDFKTVIDIKVAEWKGTERDKFLRPETLFGPKFEGYLNQKPPKPQKKFRDEWGID